MFAKSPKSGWTGKGSVQSPSGISPLLPTRSAMTLESWIPSRSFQLTRPAPTISVASSNDDEPICWPIKHQQIDGEELEPVAHRWLGAHGDSRWKRPVRLLSHS